MPHWNGIVDAASPPGYPSKDPVAFERKLKSSLPRGVTAGDIDWSDDRNDWNVSVTLRGPATAQAFLENDLQATNVKKLLTASEKEQHRNQ